MAEFLFAPTPHKQAVKFIADKPLVSRAVFDKLLPDLKARVFTIAGVQAADVLQRCRDRIAELPAGGDWEAIKKDLHKELTPYFVDPSEDEENQEKQRKAAERRAELLLRTHGQQAYAIAHEALHREQIDLFPFAEYLSLGDAHVRPTHAALDHIVLPADHEFWNTHTPPWEWGCRCQKVPRTRADVEAQRQAERGKPKDQQHVLDDYAQQDLTTTRRLVRNGVTYNLRSQYEEGKPGAFFFDATTLKPSLEQLEARYDAQTWADFKGWAKKTRIEDINKTVWGWLGGSTEWPELSELKVVKRLGGSTGAQLVKDLEGRFFVRKEGNSAEHIRSEVAADLAYQALGLEVPKVKLYDGKTKLAELVKGETLQEALAKATPAEAQLIIAKVQRGFVADALLANYDVIGLGMDNILVDPSGQVWRIDNGGSFDFRAQGARKTFGPEVTELKTMRDAKINPSAARIFGGITDAEIQRQIAEILEKREALLAAVPAELRDAMEKRLEYLANYGKKVEATPDNPFTVEFAEAARKSRIVGKQIDMDSGDIEDSAALVWTETDAAGAQLTKVKMKLTEAGMAKMLERMKGSLPTVSPAAAAVAFDEAAVYKQVLDAAKTVNHHQADGAYNVAKIAALEQAKKSLDTAVKKKLIAEEDAAHYLGLIDGVKAAHQGKTAAPQVTQKGIKLLPPPKSAKVPEGEAAEFDVKRVPITYAQKTIANGHAIAQPNLIFNKGTTFETEIDGVKIRFKPYEEPPNSSLYALQGTVEIELKAPLNKAALDQIHAALGKTGIDNKPVTPQYQESLYLWRGINLRRDVVEAGTRSAAAAILGDKDIDDAERLGKLRALVKSETKLKLPESGAAGFNPAGEGNTFGEGYRRYWRWDMSREQVEKDMEGYVLTHHSSMPTPHLLEAWLTQGGDATTTTERLRKGVAIHSGLSPEADLNYGTSSYFFTRIKARDKAAPAGQFHFKIGNLARQDTLSMGGDWLGGEHQIWKPGVRENNAVKPAQWKANAKKGANETLFKWGFNIIDELDTIIARTASEHKEILAVFAKHGWTDDKPLPDGRKPSEIVKMM